MTCAGSAVFALFVTLPLVRPASAAPQGPQPTLAACEAAVRATRTFGDWLCFVSLARSTGRFDEAAEVMRGLLDEQPSDPMGWFSLALVREDQSSPEGLADYRRALALYERIDDPLRVLWTRLAIGRFAIQLGRLDEAEDELRRAEVLMPPDRPADPYARLLLAQGWLAYARGDFGTALRRFQSAAAPATGLTELEAQRLSGLGAVLWATGRAAQAREYYRRQASLLQAAGSAGEEASARVNLALIAVTLREPVEEQRRLAREALAVAEAGRNRAAAGRAHAFLASASTGAEAVRHAEASLALLDGIAPDRALALRSLAWALHDSDVDRAFTLIEAAIAEAVRIDNPHEVARGMVIRSRIRWEVGPRDRAIDESLEMLDAIEATRLIQPETDMRAMRFASWGTPYLELVSSLLRDPRPASSRDLDLAVETIERSRARGLLDAIDVAGSPSALSPDAHAARDRILRDLVGLQRRLVAEPMSDEERVDALDRLAALEREEREIRSRAARAAVLAEPSRPRFATGDEISAELGGGEAFVTIYAPWAVVHTSRGATVHELPAGDAATVVGLFNQLVTRRDGSETAAAVRLYHDLLGPVLDALPAGTTRLIISPDAALQVLPFDVLRPAVSADPLVSTHVVSMVPSATTWLRWRRAPRSAADLATLVSADPTLAWSNESAPGGWRALTGGDPLGRLPHARREAQAIDRRLPLATLALGDAATESALKQAGLAQYGLLHFATHAIIDDVHPARSAIMLGPGSPEEDGLLQPREIVELDLADRVVVLSACQSATGLVVGGEGVLGLTHAFFQAGARAVVASSWPLEDREAADLFTVFYDRLSGGATLAEALADARRERMRAGAAPAAWAGVTVYGDGDFAPFSGSATGRAAWNPTGTAATVLALLLAGAAVVLLVRKGRRH